MELRAFLLACGTAFAATSLWTASAGATSCMNDIECTANGTACGSDVCDWTKAPIQMCKPAAQSPGWCTVDTDCKCNAQGAVCKFSNCTFVKLDGGAGGGSSSSSSGGSSSSGSGSGSSSGTGSSSSGSSGSSSSGGGGCIAVGSGASAPWGFAAVTAAVGFAIARRRRQR